ncbi:MAG: 60S ribosomal protein L26 [Candidatus Roizmanbacteria bacterium]
MPYLILNIGQQAQIPLHPSNCVITQLKLDKNRKSILERKKRVAKQKNKHREGMAGID